VKRAIIVAGHAIWDGIGDPNSDASWALLDFQRGEPPCYVEHVRRGVELASGDPEALLVFSGGPSRREAGPRSEARSYREIAVRFGWKATSMETEEYARDSFENLLFGICRFRLSTGAYPDFVTVVSWAFKERRFHLHREAIGWPAQRFAYDGPNDPPYREQALAAEEVNAGRYVRDPYSSGSEFRRKREDRNPFQRRAPYPRELPELAELFHQEGPDLYRGPLPWRIS
jgi:hypothetical protein